METIAFFVLPWWPLLFALPTLKKGLPTPKRLVAPLAVIAAALMIVSPWGWIFTFCGVEGLLETRGGGCASGVSFVIFTFYVPVALLVATVIAVWIVASWGKRPVT